MSPEPKSREELTARFDVLVGKMLRGSIKADERAELDRITYQLDAIDHANNGEIR